jgi:hypothetical protein
MKKVTIYENEGTFDIHDENGKLIKGGFSNQGEAVFFCKKNSLFIIDVFFVV